AQHARPKRIQRLVQGVAVLAELRHFLRPQVRRHELAVLGIVRDLAADVPELLQVEVLAALGGLHPERGVAAGAAAAGHVVPLLHLLREGEELLEGGVGVVDQFRRNAMVADAGKAPLAVGRTELGNEGLAVGVVACDVEGGDTGGHEGKYSGVMRRRPRGRRLGLCRLQPAAWRTAEARVSRVACISAASSASTVTRTTGSVPDGRRKARPRPCTADCACRSASRTPSAATTSAAFAPSRRTLTVACGTTARPSRAWSRRWPARRRTSSTCSALTMASPVVARSRHSRWPEASPPSTPPPSTRAWCT